jgi:enterobacterial common antigen flippase
LNISEKKSVALALMNFFIALLSVLKNKALYIILGASGYGLYGVFISAMSMVQSLGGTTLDYYITKRVSRRLSIKFDSGAHGRTLNAVYFIIALVTLLQFFSVLAIYSFKDDDFVFIALYATISIFSFLITSGILSYTKAKLKTFMYAVSNVISVTVNVTTLVLLLYVLGEDGLYLSIAIATIAQSLTTILISKYKHLVEELLVKFEYNKFTVRSIKVSLPKSYTTLINTGSQFIIISVIGYFGSIEEVGIYFAINGIVSQVSSTAIVVSGGSYYPELVGLIDTGGKRALNRMVWSQTALITLFMFSFVSLILINSELILSLLFDDSMGRYAYILQLMLFLAFFACIKHPVELVLYAINNPTHFLKVTSLSAFLNILIGSVVYIEFGLRGLALALILNSIVVSIYILTIVNKNTEVDQNKELMFYFLTAILFLTAVIKLNIGFIVVAFMTIIMFTWYLKRLRLDKL